jgi:hypothetical protein
VFARKLIRPTTKEDVGSAINKLKGTGISDNIVVVLRNDWLTDSTFYYIDMDQYETSLEQYILGVGPYTYERSENPRLLGAGSGERGIWNTWDIMEQISSGVVYIHQAKLVHGNLKTRNGNLISFANCKCCSLQAPRLGE